MGAVTKKFWVGRGAKKEEEKKKKKKVLSKQKIIIIIFFLEKSRNLSRKKKKKKKRRRKWDKPRNLFKFVSILLSASVERVGVSRMQDFFVM